MSSQSAGPTVAEEDATGVRNTVAIAPNAIGSSDRPGSKSRTRQQGLLALQRMAGNAAVSGLLARGVDATNPKDSCRRLSRDAEILPLQRTAGDQALARWLGEGGCDGQPLEPLAVQRRVRVGTPRNRFFPPARAAEMQNRFLALLNVLSTANQLTLNGDELLQWVARPGAGPLSEFDKFLRRAIQRGATVPLTLIGRHNIRLRSRTLVRSDVDDYQSGYVDLDDLEAEEFESARMNIVHVLGERFATPTYERRVGTPALENTRALNEPFDRAHRQGLLAERDYLRSLLRDRHIGAPREVPGPPLRFVFSSSNGYTVVHTLPTVQAQTVMQGDVRVHQGGAIHTVDQWQALHPAGFP